MRSMHGTERGRLLEKLLRELVRAELFAVEHVEPQVMRLGECAPVDALREVANHALVGALHAGQWRVQA